MNIVLTRLSLDPLSNSHRHSCGLYLCKGGFQLIILLFQCSQRAGREQECHRLCNLMPYSGASMRYRPEYNLDGGSVHRAI